MVKVILIDDSNDSYNAVVASGSETPYQILKMNHINPATRKVFVNGRKVNDVSINTPFSNMNVKTIYIAVRL